jgi:hypothetical protein
MGMIRPLAAVLAVLLAAPAGAINPPTALQDRAMAAMGRPARLLCALISFASVQDDGFRSGLQGIESCIRGGGRAGLHTGADAAGAPLVSLSCVLGDEPYTATMAARHLALFNDDAYDRPALRVVDGVLGYGTGNPAPGGMPSANWTPIRSSDAAPAVLRHAWERERAEQPRL